MPPQVGFFGGRAQGRIAMGKGPLEDVRFNCDLWFDRDIDGRWLVCVAVLDTGGDEKIGAIVVKDETIGTFIESLSMLIADPEKFLDHPELSGPVWKPLQN